VQLACLGGGDPSRWRAMAQELGVADSVQFCGTLPSGAPVLEWMDSIDLYMIPSLQEGLPRALVEAMTRALPAVGATTGGIPELLGGEYTHSPKDDVHLSRLVCGLMRAPEEMARCSRTNFERSKAFAPSVLDARRDAFLEAFKCTI
jgi:glycosyltransferase involved in cell wall biosynthesis